MAMTTPIEKKVPGLKESDYQRQVILYCLRDKYLDKERRSTHFLTGIDSYLFKNFFNDWPSAQGRGVTKDDLKKYRRSITTYWNKVKDYDKAFLAWKNKMPQLFRDNSGMKTIEDTLDTLPTFIEEFISGDKEKVFVEQSVDNEKVSVLTALKNLGVKNYRDTEYGMEVQF